MKLDKVKHIIAKKHGFKDWSHLRDHHSKHGLEITLNEVAELYAKSKVKPICDVCGHDLAAGLFCPKCEF